MAMEQPIERVSFYPSVPTSVMPALDKAADGTVNGAAAGGSGPDEPAKPPLAAKIQKEVSAPLAGVQTALLMDVALWEHTKTFRSLSHGLYVMPKVRLPCKHGAGALQFSVSPSAACVGRHDNVAQDVAQRMPESQSGCGHSSSDMGTSPGVHRNMLCSTCLRAVSHRIGAPARRGARPCRWYVRRRRRCWC